MGITKKSVMLACDFETVVYKGQKSTEVWSASYARLFSDKVMVFHSLPEMLRDIFDYRCNVYCWFHNLRFDGSFIVLYLLEHGWQWTNAKKTDTKQFKTLISKENRWYSITLNTGNGIIEIRDSVKIMPMKLKELHKAFNTEHEKLEMEYEGRRYAGCNITQEEMEYIINDVLLLKEALEVMINEGHIKLTIGSCALDEYKHTIGKRDFENLMPNLKNHEIDAEYYGHTNAESFIRKTYKGAFCYCKPEHQGKFIGAGHTFDVNSLYPSMMHSKSGNYYPIGQPHFWRGDIPSACYEKGRVWFVKVKCRFKLKEGMLPTLQIKNSKRYPSNKWLTTSDILYRGKYYSQYYDENGKLCEAVPILYMTMSDYELFMEHYEVTEIEYMGGCWFYGRQGLFDEYINKWMKQKEESTGGKRTIAKLFQNSLYGKFASSDDSSYRVPTLNSYHTFDLPIVEEHEKAPVYIPIGSMIISYARCFTIRHAQDNYENFVYADTDSLHMLKGEVKNIDIHPTHLLCWKKETEWSSAIFHRQKTYAEFIRKKDDKKIYPKWEITCAGMPERCKKLFLAEHPITDFKIGLKQHGKLLPKMISGGIILQETYFTLHKY